MPTLNTQLVGLGSGATLIYGAQGSAAGLIQVINLDTENTVYLGNQSNIMIGQAGVFPLTPGSSMSFSGSIALYGVTVAGQTVEVGIVPGGGNYSNGTVNISGPVTAEISGPVDAVITGTADVSVQNANIDVIGAGGFIAPGQIASVYDNSSGNVTAGPSSVTSVFANLNVQTFASIIFTQNQCSNSSVAAGAAVCAVWEFGWTDVNGALVATDTVSCAIGTGAVWEIPCRGAFLSLTLVNVGTVGTITAPHLPVAIIVDGSFRVIPNIRVVNSNYFGGTTITGGTVVTQPNPAFNINQWIASISYSWAGAIANTVFLLPLWAGQVTGFYQVITTALAKNATIVDLSFALQGQVVSGGNYAFGVIQNIPGSIDPNPVPITFNLPPSQCALILDTPAAVGEFFLSLIGIGN